jgi:hypothetical protein
LTCKCHQSASCTLVLRLAAAMTAVGLYQVVTTLVPSLK